MSDMGELTKFEMIQETLTFLTMLNKFNIDDISDISRYILLFIMSKEALKYNDPSKKPKGVVPVDVINGYLSPEADKLKIVYLSSNDSEVSIDLALINKTWNGATINDSGMKTVYKYHHTLVNKDNLKETFVEYEVKTNSFSDESSDDSEI